MTFVRVCVFKWTLPQNSIRIVGSLPFETKWEWFYFLFVALSFSLSLCVSVSRVASFSTELILVLKFFPRRYVQRVFVQVWTSLTPNPTAFCSNFNNRTELLTLIKLKPKWKLQFIFHAKRSWLPKFSSKSTLGLENAKSEEEKAESCRKVWQRTRILPRLNWRNVAKYECV